MVTLTLSPHPAPAAHRALILTLERTPYIEILERYFRKRAGYRVEFIGNGEEALAQARRLPPDILVAEILVPRLDGLSVCRALKANPATRHIKVLIVSVLAAEDRARDAGADAFLRKPLDDADLIRAVERLLARHRHTEADHDETN